MVNVRNYSTAVVAQHTFAMALYLLEKLRYYDDYVKNGVYASQSSFSHFGMTFGELEGKTWGIVGMGNIGRKVASIAQAFGCRVIFYSASGKSTCTDYEQVDFDTLLAQSDVLSLHCPLSDRTRGLIDLAAMKKMKPSAVLINVARGPVVKEADLCTALKENLIAAAGAGCAGEGAYGSGQSASGVSGTAAGFLITPHMAWASLGSQNQSGDGNL